MKINEKQGIYKEYLKDKKTVFTILCLTLAFVIVILISFGVNLVLRPLNSEEFLSDLALSFALCVYCLYFGIPEGKNLYQKKEKGRYKNALANFELVRSKVKSQDIAFNQWLNKYYEENKKDYLISILTLHGNINPYVLDLDYYELDNLKKPYKKSWEDTEFEGRKDTYFRSLNEEQIEVIKNIFNGKIKVEKIPNDFFKTINGKIILNEYIEQSRATKKNTLSYALLIFYRIIMVFAFAFLISIFGFQIASYGGDNLAQEVVSRVIQMISRIWTMLSSFIYGFAVGKIMVMKESRLLEYKTRVNELFLSDTTFTPLSEEEIAKNEYEKYENSVVKGEIINTPALEYKEENNDTKGVVIYGRK